MTIAVLTFLVAGAILVAAAVILALAGDDIAAGTRFGAVAVGAVLLAVATSLPEIVTNTTAVLSDLPDLAIGDLLGASMANMASLAVIDLLSRRRVWPAVDLGQARLAAIAIGLLAVAGVGLANDDLPSVGWIGVETILIAVLYGGAIIWIHRGSRGPLEPGTDPLREPTQGARLQPLRKPAIRFIAAAAAIGVAAPAVVRAAEAVAHHTGLSHAFVGTALVAVTTALPEFVVAVSAVRIGAANLAVGNLLGSTAFNMALLAPLDIVTTDGPLLRHVDSAHAVAAFIAIVLVALSQAGLVHGQETRIRRAEPDAVLVLAAYALGLVVVGGAG